MLPGKIEFTWQEVMIGFESSLLMFPINLLIVQIFRNIRSQPKKEKKPGKSGRVSPDLPAPLQQATQNMSLTPEAVIKASHVTIQSCLMLSQTCFAYRRCHLHLEGSGKDKSRRSQFQTPAPPGRAENKLLPKTLEATARQSWKYQEASYVLCLRPCQSEQTILTYMNEIAWPGDKASFHVPVAPPDTGDSDEMVYKLS